jgi:hypothetical protein
MPTTRCPTSSLTSAVNCWVCRSMRSATNPIRQMSGRRCGSRFARVPKSKPRKCNTAPRQARWCPSR